jgi:hypothetical protein
MSPGGHRRPGMTDGYQIKETLVVEVKNHHACRQMFRRYSQSDGKPPMIGLQYSKQRIFRLSTLGVDSGHPALVVPAGEVTIPNNVAQRQET